MVEPGPWEVDEEGRIYHRRGPLSRYIVANMESGDEDNWKLVAAAPDLLAMLKLAQIVLDADGRFDMRGINAAIAKAEGHS